MGGASPEGVVVGAQVQDSEGPCRVADSPSRGVQTLSLAGLTDFLTIMVLGRKKVVTLGGLIISVDYFQMDASSGRW